MQQHPLPQNISAYQFHLIGSMTLKQFLYLAGGIGVAWFIYSLPLLLPLKWVLMGTTILTGITFSFVPYQDRPLDHWFTTFLKRIYTPTQFTWKKSPQLPAFLTPSHNHKQVAITTPATTVQDRKSLETYLKTLPSTSPPSPLDVKDHQALSAINQLFQSFPVSPSTIPIPIPAPILKTVKVSVRKLKTPPPNYTIQQQFSPTLSPTPSITVTPSLSVVPDASSSSSPGPIPYTSSSLRLSEPNGLLAPSNKSTIQATTNVKLPFPQSPTIPNVLVGMTLDSGRNIIDNAIIEIRDLKNHPVRALKSNKLGQFYIATPLPNGTYTIDTEKDSFSFETRKIVLEGKIIPPLEIRALPSRSSDALERSGAKSVSGNFPPIPLPREYSRGYALPMPSSATRLQPFKSPSSSPLIPTAV